jgi:microcystin-dependent protein
MTISLARNLGNLGNVLSTNGNYATQATAPVLDISNDLATTRFVKNSGKTFSNIYPLSVSTALSLSYTGGLCSVSASGTIQTLPPIGTCPVGTTITFYGSLTTGSFTIKGSTTELISQISSPAGANTLVLYPGESIEIVAQSTNWLGVNYVRLNNPSFASPIATVTPPQFDSSTKIPNTSWVAGAGVQYGPTSRSTTVANTTLTASDVGTAIFFNNSTNQSVTLPSPAGFPVGASITLEKALGGILTILSYGGASSIDSNFGVVSSVTLKAGESVRLILLASQIWICTGTYPFRLGTYKVGEIRTWHGAVGNITVTWGPGWQLADGTNGTADLRDKFLVGAGNSYATGNTGGAATVSLSVAQLPSHTHGISDPGHAHGVADPGHAHGYVAGNVAGGNSGPGAAMSNLNNSVSWPATQGAGTGIGIYGAATGVSVQATGSGGAIENRPPYYALCFIEYVGF